MIVFLYLYFYHREARLFGIDSLQLSVSTASALLVKLKAGISVIIGSQDVRVGGGAAGV